MAQVEIEGYLSTGLKTVASHTAIAIKASAGILGGLTILGAAADVTAILYDDPDSAHGTVLAKYILDVDKEGLAVHIPLPDVPFALGCWAVVTGTGGEYIVYYK